MTKIVRMRVVKPRRFPCVSCDLPCLKLKGKRVCSMLCKLISYTDTSIRDLWKKIRKFRR